MTTIEESGPVEVAGRRRLLSPAVRTKARWGLGGMLAGIVFSVWAAGGPDRYGEPDGLMGLARGVCRTIHRGFRYTAANCRDAFAENPSSVRTLGLAHQVEARLSQDKKLDAQGITLDVEDDGTVVLEGLVPDATHKDRAATLARDTRGVVKVVDHLAVPPPARIIDAPPAAGRSVDVATRPTVRE